MNVDIYTTMCILQHHRYQAERGKNHEASGATSENLANGLENPANDLERVEILDAPIRIREFGRRQKRRDYSKQDQ